MRAGRNRNLIIAGSAVVLIAIAAIVTFLLFNINSYKGKIETAASGATGLDVKINGKMGLTFFPFGVSAKDIHVAGREGEILSLERLKLQAELMPLLKKQLKVTGCELVKPVATIVRDTQGKYNFEIDEQKPMKGWGTPFSLNDLRLSGGTLAYLDKDTGEKTELKEINLAIRDMTVAGASANIIKNVSFTGTLGCKEVLQKDVRIENLKASIKATKGTYNIQPLTMDSLIYSDKRAGDKTELKEINLAIKDMTVSGTPGGIIKNVSFTGTVECRELRKKDLKAANIKSPVKADKGVFYLKPLTVDIFGTRGEGDITANKSETDAEYKINLSVSKLDFEKLQESFGVKKLISGKGDLTASLTVEEREGRPFLKGMGGTMSLRGDNLITHTVDLDKVLSSYETSQEFNLVDVGAFFIAGPIGSVALKAYRYGDVYYQARGRQGTITQIISHWKIKGGVADAEDCALATRHNRVAFKGKLNLVSERYDNVTVALLDDKGCVKSKQTITGPFNNPQVGVVSAVESLGGSVMNLYRQGKRLIHVGKCEVFYNGSVKQPR
jgi:uncharacterized protein involved in outer membrane biogenesis